MVHPFAGFVTVNVYMPAAETTDVEFVGVLPAGVTPVGPVQEYVAPGVDELPFNVMVDVTQLIVRSGPTLICGGVVLAVTVTAAVFVHPFIALVVVKV